MEGFEWIFELRDEASGGAAAIVRQLKAVDSGFDNAKAAMKPFESGLGKVQDLQLDVALASKRLAGAEDALAKSLAEAGSETGDLTEEQLGLVKSVRSAEREFKDASGSLDRYNKDLANMGKANTFGAHSASALKTVGVGLASGLLAVAAAAAAAAAAVGVLASKFLADAIEKGAEFEQTMVSATAKFPGEIRRGTEAYAELEAAAKQVGATTEFTASQAANGLNFLAMAGFDARQSVAALPGIVDLATAAELDLARASDIATDTLGAFNLTTSDSVQLGKNLARVNDVLVKTANSANTSVDQLFEAFKEGAPVATTAGLSIETFSAMAAVLANAGLKGSIAGTALKNVILGLSAPSATGAKELKNLGIETKDAAGNMRDPIAVLSELKAALGDLGTAEQTAALENIFGREAVAGAGVLLQAGEGIRDFEDKLNSATGTAEEQAKTMRDTLSNAWKTFNSAIEDVQLSVFEELREPLDDLVKSTTEWVGENKQLIASGAKQFVEGLTEAMPYLVAGLKATGSAVMWVADNWDTIGPILKGVGIAIGVVAAVFTVAGAAIMAPVFLVIGVIGALVAATLWLVDQVVNGIPKIPEAVSAALALAKQWFANLATEAPQLGSNIVDGLVNGIRSRITSAVKAASDLASAVSSTVKGALQIGSPSKLMQSFGGFTGEGLSGGLDDAEGEVAKSAKNLGKTVEAGVVDSLGIHSPSAVMADLGAFTAEGLTTGVNDNAAPGAFNPPAVSGASSDASNGAQLSSKSGGNTFIFQPGSIVIQSTGDAAQDDALLEERLTAIFERVSASQGEAA